MSKLNRKKMDENVPLLPKEEDSHVDVLSRAGGGTESDVGNTVPQWRQTVSASSEHRIVLVGKTGSGKSSTGNTILGLKCFHEKVSAESVTKTCKSGEVKEGDRIISVIDTPGLFDTTMSTQKMKKEIVKCVEMSVPGPHVFLLVIRLNVRFTNEEKNTVKWIQENFGQEAASYTIILFTHADQLNENPLDLYIRESNDLKALVNECGGRFHSFNNNDTKNRSQVTELLKKIEKMVEENGGGHYTDEMYQEAQRRILDRSKFWLENPRIVLLGKTGSGKNSTVETIVGQESLKSGTCKLHEALVDEKSMQIFDTAGLFNASNEKKMKDEIENFVIMSVPGPHVFLLVIKVDEERETDEDEEKNTVKWIQENIGVNALSHTIILFTHADQLMGKSLDKYISERRFLQSLIESCDGRFHSFNNEDRSDHNQVTELLEKIENMAESNGWRYYTNEMFKEILIRNIRRQRNISIAVGAVGTVAAVAGGVVMGTTSLVAAPAVLIAGGVTLVAAAAAAVGRAIHKNYDKKV